ncbi:efflux RND transporter permease subunit [Cocleimonas flava]|uniref:Multidrug efflux pump subunit AcrB n=1 Tax=Cocleimonas flava TaxID=634765 RepID=A0A4R1F8C3_9GAMM|nr:efflux RND transporter permease subunit [Cocleimonas flava]TCJ88929.1 multidrug efflux pump subunit AcrB [Cocleimonas flava]
MYSRLIQNHVLANLTFVLVLIIGFLSYKEMPRQQDPTINFNWITIITALPGASASDVEKRVTDVLEDSINGISDMNFVSSNSRENISSILVRFEDIPERRYDKRLADLRRELQNVQNELPEEALDSQILEITSGNAFPAALVAVVSDADDERLRKRAQTVSDSIEQMTGVDRVDSVALDDPELQINFIPEALESLQLTPGKLADSLKLWFQDVSAGTTSIGKQSWLVRIVGKNSDPSEVAQFPIPGLNGEVPLSRVAVVQRARKKASQEVSIDGKPAVLLSVMKQDNTNVIQLVDQLNQWVDEQNNITENTGIQLQMVDDQTLPTKQAINIMQSNALIGLLLVLIVAWLFLGTRIALLTAIGIPFILAATFWVLAANGETLNITVLLGVVIVLGMLVDDAVVVVESIYYRLQRGMNSLDAATGAMKEVALPVTTAVLTTIAAFLPLMLLPGILGKFMRVIPMVVTIALIISLIEAFWMLPSHVHGARINFAKPSRIQRWRESFIHWIQLKYSKVLIRALRWPKMTLLTIFLAFATAIGALSAGMIRVDFFASDTLRIFYVNVEMPTSTPLDETLSTTLKVEAAIKKHLKGATKDIKENPDTVRDARSVASYAGLMFTETEPMYGDQYGQIVVSLLPMDQGSRDVDTIINEMREDVTSVVGANNISFLKLQGGPPSSKPISVKVRGDDYQTIKQASDKLREILEGIKGIKDINDDASRGRMELTLKMNHDAVRRSGINPMDITRTVRLLVDGEVVAEMQDKGEKLQIRVKADSTKSNDIGELLRFRMPTPSGSNIPLNQLMTQERGVSLGNIRHYNFRRAITLEADIDKPKGKEDFMACRLRPALYGEERDYSQCELDTVTANKLMLDGWEKYRKDFPSIDLDFSGQLDDIKDSINSIAKLFLIGIGLMYLILGTQFKSYFQPFIILATVPLAFTGVILGLLVTQNPLSLYTLYGVVALAGIAVNAAIVLISAANDRIYAGMSAVHATIYASRRRVIPIMITTLTTIAGLMSLAVGLGGQSLIWGPVATSIVWGVGFSSLLTLFAIPTLYLAGMRRKERKRRKQLKD